MLDVREPVKALDDERRRDAVRQVGDELARRWVERGEVDLQCIAEEHIDVLPAGEPVGEVRLERAIELDSVDPRDPVGEIHGEHAEPRPDLEHDVIGVELGEPSDDAEDVLVDEEVLAELLLRQDVHDGRPKHSAALRSVCRSSAFTSSPRARASAASVCTTYAGSFRLPRTGCGAR